MSKRERLKNAVLGCLSESIEAIKTKTLDKALNSGAININDWDEENSPMILVKGIIIGILKSEAEQYSAKGTNFEKAVEGISNRIRISL